MAGDMHAHRVERILNLATTLMNTHTPLAYSALREMELFSIYRTDDYKSGERSFERDKAALVSLGVPVQWENFGREKGYWLSSRSWTLAATGSTTLYSLIYFINYIARRGYCVSIESMSFLLRRSVAQLQAAADTWSMVCHPPQTPDAFVDLSVSECGELYLVNAQGWDLVSV